MGNCCTWRGRPLNRCVMCCGAAIATSCPGWAVEYLVGATVEDAGFDERATAAGVRDLLEAGCSLVPHLWQASFTEVRVGLRPASPDGLPIVGRSSAVPGLIYATGHYRNGVLLAPLTAALVKDTVLGNGSDSALATLAPSRLGVL